MLRKTITSAPRFERHGDNLRVIASSGVIFYELPIDMARTLIRDATAALHDGAEIHHGLFYVEEPADIGYSHGGITCAIRSGANVFNFRASIGTLIKSLASGTRAMLRQRQCTEDNVVPLCELCVRRAPVFIEELHD